ncbi:PUA-like domain-containing protein [Flagelloscypha sp. PMI_526]|nr:PUA-like domain-containing protein [Flagelloscypha sp. PMI_526]
MPKISKYELEREANIARNMEFLKSLGLDKPMFEPREVKPKPARKPAKRKEAPTESSPESTEEPSRSKVARLEGDESASAGTRRSARNAGKKVDYSKEVVVESPMPISFTSGVKTTDHQGPLGSEEGTKRRHNPKTYGSIPDVEVGTWWQGRPACSADAIHAPWVAGIAPGPEGAYSVAMSGGYDDDVDLGYAFTYTGSGGRDLKGTAENRKNLRTAPQSSDQNFENTFNKSLKKSCETKKPVRVIRGYKLPSRYAPSEGYRYDGLYTVEKAWIEQGIGIKFKVCKFAFKRLPDQPPIPVRAGFREEDEEGVSAVGTLESASFPTSPENSGTEDVSMDAKESAADVGEQDDSPSDV